MHVELRHTQVEACRRAIAGQRPHLSATYEHWFVLARRPSETIRVIAMPAIGWSILADALSDELYLPNGRVRGKPMASMKSALKHVRTQVMTRESHPALKGEGVVGELHDIIPAWKERSDMDSATWSPYPIPGGHYALLEPRAIDRGGIKVTLWPARVVVRTGEGWRGQEAHWAFLTSPADQPSAELPRRSPG